ncbi:hypothetical protein DPMN_072631 [Dreissena polymorpha]|uniref:Uncharacterized protein n=1 Tax=Dreissena polymorpha TaxID=45954 RepID=A0A9D4HBZ2_DREPO|nr:hypothetical protein DPMN_072631 [Dreissena polymorpha]
MSPILHYIQGYNNPGMCDYESHTALSAIFKGIITQECVIVACDYESHTALSAIFKGIITQECVIVVDM